MEVGDFVKVIIAAVMMIVVVTVIVIPVLQDNEVQEMTGHNTATQYATDQIPAGVYVATAGGYTIDGGSERTLADRAWIIMSDSVIIQKRNDSSLYVRDFTEHIAATVTDVTIGNGTYSYTQGGSTISHTLGTNAITRTTTPTDMGIYADSFRVDKDQPIRMYIQTQNVEISTDVRVPVSLLVEGTADNLIVKHVIVHSQPETWNATATAAIHEGWIGSPNDEVWAISADPRVDVTLTIDGTTINTFTANYWTAVTPVAPTAYTEIAENESAINAMLGIVPLLMIVGVIIMVVTAAVIRR